MPTYDSESSDGEDGTYTETSTLLGYSSKEPTDDIISQLGGQPVRNILTFEEHVLILAVMAR